MSATNDTSGTPSGWTALAGTGAPTGWPVASRTWAVTARLVSSSRVPVRSNRPTMSGLEPPAQTELEITRGRRSSMAIDGSTDGATDGDATASPEGSAAVDSTVPITAVIV